MKPATEKHLIAKIAGTCSKLICLMLVAACGTTGIGVPWIPQGPGETAEEARARREAQARGEAPPQRAPQAAAGARVPEAPVPGRRMDVAPDLVAQSPPPPRSAAQQAAAQAPGGALAGAYTQASRYGDLLFVSGQIALDPQTNQLRGATIEEQTRQVMENIRAILESHRLTMANVVSATVYLKDMNDFRGMNTAYETYFRTSLPARSVVEVARLPRGGLVEISAVAGR